MEQNNTGIGVSALEGVSSKGYGFFTKPDSVWDDWDGEWWHVTCESFYDDTGQLHWDCEFTERWNLPRENSDRIVP